MFKKKYGILKKILISMAMLFIITGCNREGNTETTGRVLRIANSADAVSLDPAYANEGFSALVNTQMYETLVTRDADLNFIPGLAQEWERIDDLTYEFRLTEGVYFHNGEPLTANDVAFSLLRALESPIAQPILGEVDPDGIEVIDELTIRVSSKTPFAPLLANLGHSTAFIVSEAAVLEHGDDFAQNPVGTGPFMFKNWDAGNRIELVRNENYRGELPQTAGIEFRVVPEVSNRVIELETNQVDMSFNISPSDVQRIEASDDLEMVRRATLMMTYIGFNTQVEPFNDVRVRQAINYAVDVNLIVETILEGIGIPLAGPMGTNIPGAPTDLEGFDYNPERAKELLAEAGLEDGFSATILTDGNADRVNVVTAVAHQLQQIGINLNIQSLDLGAFLEAINNGQHDMFIHTWTTVTGDPDYALYPLLHSSHFGSAGNRSFFENEEVDSLLERARATLDFDTREQYYREVSKIIIEEAPWVFLNTSEWLVATRSDVRGYTVRLNGQQRLDGVYFQ